MKAKVWPALIALYVIWGSTYLAIRFAVETIPPFLSAGIRFFVSGVVLLAWRRAAGDPMPTARQWRSEALVGVLLLLGGNGLVSYAEKRIASGVAALIVGTVPLWLVLLEAIRPRGTKPGRRSLAGLAVGFAGVLILVGPRELTGGRASFDGVGIGAVMLASLLWSIGSIYSRTAAHPSAALVGPGAQMLAGSAALFVVSAAIGEFGDFRPGSVAGRSWAGLAYLIAFGSLVGYVSYVWLLRNAPVSLVATYAYVNPLVAILLGATLASEPLTPRIALAAAIIIGSVVLTNSRARPRTAD
ncbi:MAG: EamA family transporter [Candidatus Latescibacterota bacterium]|nr:MAG: EamA family transporter [Candidatus Latescibacterota bacterium]